MSATTTSPAWKRPGATTSPTLRPWNVTVTSASTAAPAISPVDASTPEGRSTDTTGAPRRVHPLDQRRRVRPRLRRGTRCRRARRRRRPSPTPARSSRLDDVASGLAEDPRGDPPVTAVRAAAAHDGYAPRVRDTPVAPPAATAAPARSISSPADVRVARIPLLGGAHLGRGVEGLVHHGRDAGERRREIGDRSPRRSCASASARGRSRASPTRSANASVLPASVTPGFGRPTISISFQVKSDAAAERLPDRLLAAEPRGVRLGRVAARLAVRLLVGREAAVAEARTLERAPDPLDLDHVRADPHRHALPRSLEPARQVGDRAEHDVRRHVEALDRVRAGTSRCGRARCACRRAAQAERPPRRRRRRATSARAPRRVRRAPRRSTRGSACRGRSPRRRSHTPAPPRTRLRREAGRGSSATSGSCGGSRARLPSGSRRRRGRGSCS